MRHNAFAAALRRAKGRWKENLQGFGSSPEIDKRDIPLAPLNPTDLGTIEATDVGKLLLRHG
jgi:hypothetical protein